MSETKSEDKNNVLVDSGKNLAIGTGAVVGVNAASSAIISAYGFTQAGIAAGSAAAAAQSAVGAVAAGSWFASFQSLGALGFGILGTAALPVAVGTGVVLGSIPIIKKFWPKKK